MPPLPRMLEGMQLRVGSVIEDTEAEGPGRRFALWVQGCSLRCPGCCNPHLFPADGSAVEVALLLERLARARDPIEGISLLGGEPFEQAAALARFAQGARSMGLTVMTFTGYTREELAAPGLLSQLPGTEALLAQTDLLVDGRYEARRPETLRRWAGSTNQRFYFLTDAYAPGIERVPAGGPAETVEVRLLPDGEVHVNGWPALTQLPRRR